MSSEILSLPLRNAQNVSAGAGSAVHGAKSGSLDDVAA
jgi:hypothetical protein